MSKPPLRIKKGTSACGHMEVHWARKEQEGQCNVCSHDDERSASRWVALITIRQHVHRLCPTHLRELQNVIDKLNHPPAARHIQDEVNNQ